MTSRIVFITIGEAPRKDLQAIYDDYFIGRREVKQIGLLDGLSHTEAEERFGLSEDAGTEMLTSRFIDGHQVVMAQDKVEARLQEMINQMETEGVALIGLLCTGDFKGLKAERVELQMAEAVVMPYMKEKYRGLKLGVLAPLNGQVAASRLKWQLPDDASVFTSASPYQFDEEELIEAARTFRESGVAAVVLDCIGYDRSMQQLLQAQLPGVPIYLSNEIFFKEVYEKYVAESD